MVKKTVFLLFALVAVAILCAQEVKVYPQLGHSSNVSSVAFSPDGKQIVSGSLDSTIKLWDTESGREIRTLGYTHGVLSVAFSLDGKQVLSSSFDGTLKLWDMVTGHVIRTFSGHTDGVMSVVFNPICEHNIKLTLIAYLRYDTD